MKRFSVPLMLVLLLVVASCNGVRPSTADSALLDTSTAAASVTSTQANAGVLTTAQMVKACADNAATFAALKAGKDSGASKYSQSYADIIDRAAVLSAETATRAQANMLTNAMLKQAITGEATELQLLKDGRDHITRVQVLTPSPVVPPATIPAG